MAGRPIFLGFNRTPYKRCFYLLLSKNNQVINKNKTEIGKAKKNEITTTTQVKQLETNIVRLQNEYNEAEKKYRNILTKIGVNNDKEKRRAKEIFVYKNYS